MTQESDKRHTSSLLSMVPWWSISRIICLVLLGAMVAVPIIELRAMQGSVIFYKGDEAILAWDPPSEGTVDHYVIELTITRELAGPSNTVTWVTYYTSKENRYKIETRDGYIYSFRVKAVGPAGNESPYSDEQLTIICDKSEPHITILPIDQDTATSKNSGFLQLSGKFSDDNLAEIRVEDKKATLDFENNTWYVTIPLKDNVNYVTVTARDYAGNTCSKQFEVRRRPLIIMTEPKGADIFAMGTPSYPGIFISNDTVTVGDIVNPDTRIPVTVRKRGYMQMNTVMSFNGEQNTYTLSLKTLHAPLSFICYPVTAPSVGDIFKLPYLFTADMDLDDDLDIIVSYPGADVFLLRLTGKLSDGDWNATSLNFHLEKEHTEKAEIDGQAFYIDYDGDFEYEIVAPISEEGKVHVFEECNGTTWVSDMDNVVDLTASYNDVKNFGFLDWNGDHKKDVFLRPEAGQTIYILENQGSDIDPWFSDSGHSYSLMDLNPSAPVSPCDWNGDGETDFIGQDTSGNLCVWIKDERDDEVGFEKVELPVDQTTFSSSLLSVSAADWNKDGIYDLIVGTDTGKVFLLIGRQEK